jgi:hypothetical protein
MNTFKGETFMNQKQKRKFTEKMESQHISPDRLRKNIDAERHPEEQVFDPKDQFDMEQQKTKVNSSSHELPAGL